MAVTISSDLVFDVMRNADPARKAEAVARLQSHRESVGRSVEFAGMLQGMGQAADGSSIANDAILNSTATPDSRTAYEGFERMVLRNLFESLLPAEESGAYGTGPSAGVWRSMAAEHFAGTYVQAGGLGIADALARDPDKGPAATVQWPYFSLGKIESFSG